MTSPKFQEQSSRFKEIEDRALAAEQKLQQYTRSWEEQKKAKTSETKKLEARCADLVNQNSTLHSQLEKVCLFASLCGIWAANAATFDDTLVW